MSIKDLISERGIREILHFTTNRGLVGVLATGKLRSRRKLNSDDYLKNILHQNALFRPEEADNFDKSQDWLDYVNMSISVINASYMRFSKGWAHNSKIWWYVMSFDASIAGDDGVQFATTNNGYEHCLRADGQAGLEAVFGPTIRRKEAWIVQRGRRAAHLPTCQQAELLYPGEVSVDYLRHIYVQTAEDSDRAKGWLRDFGPPHVEVSIREDVFKGSPN